MHLRRIISKNRQWGVALLVAMMVCLGACAPKHTSYSYSCDLPDEGWMNNTPITLHTQYADSSITYDITFFVRHAASYPYANLILTLDFITSDGKVKRKSVDFSIADQYGNFQGGGFGDYYQRSQLVLSNVKPADVHQVVAWQSMQGCHTLIGLHNLGITISPHAQ